MDLRGVKNIVFDFGGVLVNLNQRAVEERLTQLGIPRIQDWLTTYGHRGVFGDFENGDVDVEGFCRRVREEFHLDCSDRDIEEAWALFLEDVPYKKIKLIYQLSRRYRLFILSNCNPIHTREYQQFGNAGYPFEECFEKAYCSYRLHLSKPQREIFEYLIADAGLKPEETLLVDDSPRNCATAASLGWKTYCPGTGEDFCADLFPEETAYIESEAFQARPLQQCVATLGVFDGVHLGHRYLIDRLLQASRQLALPSLLLSFREPPREVLQGRPADDLLCSPGEKQRRLAHCGADQVAYLPFDRDMADLSARDFMEHVLRDRYHVACLLVGHDHHFGHGARESFEDYVRYGEELGIRVVKEDCLRCEDSRMSVSSSYIRRLLREGDIQAANRALGYSYSLEGRVEKGFGNGRLLGFPTANLRLDDPRKLLPAKGVYAVEAIPGHTDGSGDPGSAQKDNPTTGQTYLGMLNIGTRPTYQNGDAESIEVHLFGFEGDLYQRPLTIKLLDFIRPEVRFPSPQALRAQLEEDRRRILSTYSQS